MPKRMKPEYELKQLLSGSGITVSAAESCTGGLISHLITTVPGSSEYYLGSVTSYSPLVKVGVLGVPSSLIDESGIVSSAVAAAMAEGVRKLTGSTYSVATTGWADRYGDDREPAGTVWIAVSGPDGCHTTRFNSESTRSGNIRAFANKALEELVKHIG